MSEQSVVMALAAVADDVRAVRKDSRNDSQKFNFRGIDAVMNAVGPAFRKHGVLCLPVTEDVRYEPMPLASGKNASRCVVTVRYRFYGPAGDHIEAVVVGESFDMGDKATAKAYSVAYRTCLLQTLTIPTDDPDPDQDVYERAPREPLATPEQKGDIKGALNFLDDQAKAALKAWWKDNGLPAVDSGQLTERQAAVILDRLSASAPSAGGGDQSPEAAGQSDAVREEVAPANSLQASPSPIDEGSPDSGPGAPSAAARAALDRVAKR